MKEIYEKLSKKLCKELEEYADASISSGTLENLSKITTTIKNLKKIEMMEEDGGYSERSYPMYDGYDMGTSYRGGRMSREVGMDASYRGGYSMHGDTKIKRTLESMMECAKDPHEREEIEKALNAISR